MWKKWQRLRPTLRSISQGAAGGLVFLLLGTGIGAVLGESYESTFERSYPVYELDPSGRDFVFREFRLLTSWSTQSEVMYLLEPGCGLAPRQLSRLAQSPLFLDSVAPILTDRGASYFLDVDPEVLTHTVAASTRAASQSALIEVQARFESLLLDVCDENVRSHELNSSTISPSVSGPRSSLETASLLNRIAQDWVLTGNLAPDTGALEGGLKSFWDDFDAEDLDNRFLGFSEVSSGGVESGFVTFSGSKPDDDSVEVKLLRFLSENGESERSTGIVIPALAVGDPTEIEVRGRLAAIQILAVMAGFFFVVLGQSLVPYLITDLRRKSAVESAKKIWQKS